MGLNTSIRYRQTLQVYYDLDRDLVQVHYTPVLSLPKSTLWLKCEPDWDEWKENMPQTSDVGTD